MTRRDAIQSLALATVGTLFLPACTEKKAIELLLEDRLILNDQLQNYLNAISQSILPTAGLPDALQKPAAFILKMLNDCHAPEEIRTFASGFDQYRALLKTQRLKIKAIPAEKIGPIIEKSLEENPPASPLVFFINKIKGLSIQHLTSSQFFQQEYFEYQLIPVPYQGCQDA